MALPLRHLGMQVGQRRAWTARNSHKKASAQREISYYVSHKGSGRVPIRMCYVLTGKENLGRGIEEHHSTLRTLQWRSLCAMLVHSHDGRMRPETSLKTR